MRRGHPGAGNWRGENLRPFRPRGIGSHNFRPPRPFGSLDLPGFPPPGLRQFRGPRPYFQPPDDIVQADQHDRNKYTSNNMHRPRGRGRGYHNRGQNPSYHQLPRLNEDREDSYNESNYYQNPNQCHVNNMGDIDHRRQNQISPWTIPPQYFDNNRQYYDVNRSPHKLPRQQFIQNFDMGDDLPDYTGHRPPASDHYNTTSGPNNNNSQYSHSVDDTVDIIRKRLQNRDKQQDFDSSMEHPSIVDEDLRTDSNTNLQNVPQEQPVRKRIQRQKHNIDSNCNKMKNKIVHQLFKMDKTKINKLMDDPSSSTKFEYAISSLITEGQNSLNRHLRSAAEKSLCSSSTDFIQDDTNTIYEDTFMKQMQGVLDPQDTVLLEDIKPLVMAELSRVLQIGDYQFELMQDQRYQTQGMQDYEMRNPEMHDPVIHNSEMQNYENYTEDESFSGQYFDEVQNTEQYSQDAVHEQSIELPDMSSTCSEKNIEIVTGDVDDRFIEYEQEPSLKSELLFERRPARSIDKERKISSESRQSRISSDHEKLKSSESRQTRNSIDHEKKNISESQQLRNSIDHEKSNRLEGRLPRNSIDRDFAYHLEKSIKNSPEVQPQPLPLFDPNPAQLPDDDDDTFAEFDKQYHVAIDHSFIGNEYASRPPSPAYSCASNHKTPSERITQNMSPTPSILASNEVKNKIDAQIQNIAEMPVNLFSSSVNTIKTEPNMIEIKIESGHVLEKENLSAGPGEHVGTSKNPTPHEKSSKKKEIKKEPEKHGCSVSTISVLQPNTRKRSTDQKPSHRKEKRKRSAHSECLEPADSITSMSSTNDNSRETSKAIKKPASSSKAYSDKYVKRKDSQKKVREKDNETFKTEVKKHDNNTPSHAIISPKESHGNETLSKSDPKAKLKPIDIFGAQILKKATSHQAHRNTVTTPQVINPDDNKPKLIVPIATSFARKHKLLKRHISTQVVLKVKSKESQTNKLKVVSEHTQTNPVSIQNAAPMSANPLERMKEIDMEIQLLLQEKFKLYNSLETKAATLPIDTIPSLSMRVFKVNTEQTEENTKDPEDAIVEDFTDIPTEELEEIAMETIADEKKPKKSSKKCRQQKVKQEWKIAASPVTNRYDKKPKSPNISLIEQIITDDRPIEDIISLDELENTPRKSKKKHQKVPKKKSKKLKSATAILNAISDYKIKECHVALTRIDIDQYIGPKGPADVNSLNFVHHVEIPQDNNRSKEVHTDTSEAVNEKEATQITQSHTDPSIHLVEVVNDLQFDMLDVSEDIVIGDSCEAKTIDKVKGTLTEDIILDNSQSSMEDGAMETAGPDNECKMYDYSNESLRRDAITVTGNADAVLALECVDNNFVAACLDGNVYHFSGDGQLLNTLRGTNQAVTCLTIVKEKYGTTVYTGSLDSRMRYFDLETGMEKGPECNVLSPIQTMDRAWDTIFVGTRTGFVLQFECKNNMVIPVSTVKFSEQSILALRAMKEGPRKVLLVAARSENVVTVKDAQTGLLLRTLQGPKMTVYTLLYEDGKVYCGTSSHNIHVFDYTSGGHVGSHEGGKGAVCLRASGGLVFAGCYDGCVYVYREGEARPRAQLRGPALMLLSLAIHGTKIIAGYKDRGLYIWKMPQAIVQEMIL